jgi:hypothetical protein
MRWSRSIDDAVGSGSGTLGRLQSVVDHPEGVSAQAVDTHFDQRAMIVQIVVGGGCATNKTPAPEGSWIPIDGCAVDRRSVPPRKDDSARHTDARAGSGEVLP